MADTGNIRSLSDLLAGLGITGVEEQDEVTVALQRIMQERSISANVVGIRWGCATIEADVVNAARLRWQLEELQETVSTLSGSRVNRIRLRVTEENSHSPENTQSPESTQSLGTAHE